MPVGAEKKCRRNLRVRGGGFFGAKASRGGFTIPSGDVRDRYGEPRWVTFGWHRGEVVVLVYSSRGDDDHCISRRRAKIYETRYYLETAKKHSAKAIDRDNPPWSEEILGRPRYRRGRGSPEGADKSLDDHSA
jgi:uncharacterized DUF497 family protein